MSNSVANRVSGIDRPGLKKFLGAAFMALFSPAFGQMDYPPKVNLNDTTITTLDSLRFTPQTFGMCLYNYQSNYEIANDVSTDTIPHYLIRLTSYQHPNCAAMAGYSGPIIILKNLPPGLHKIVFTDSSDFKINIPDSVHIRVIEHKSNALLGPRFARIRARPTADSLRYSVNGRLTNRDSWTSRTLIFLHK